jgi:hypothetical protein
MKTIRLISHMKYLSAMFIMAILLTACAPAMTPSPESGPALGAAPPREFMATSVAVMPESQKAAADGSLQPAPADTDRLVIKNADLSLVVDDTNAVVDKISRMAEELGGYVVSANVYQSQLANNVPVLRGNITIRVPAEKLNQALETIKAESNQEPTSENITSQDVTSEYTDLESRLRNLEAAEKQLTQIMESAVKTEDVLNVYNQLVQVREQIEVIKGQMKYYEQSAALSAISVELVPNEAVQPLTIGGWQPVGVAKNAVQALINGLQVIANIFLWVVIFVLPVLVVLFVIFVLPLMLIFRALRRRRARRKAAAAVEKTGE